jgi:hypothetical protein
MMCVDKRDYTTVQITPLDVRTSVLGGRRTDVSQTWTFVVALLRILAYGLIVMVETMMGTETGGGHLSRLGW